MQAEYDLKDLKVKRRGRLAGLQGEEAKVAKVRVTILLDSDVVNYFKSAAVKGGLPYQTQINQALRNVIKYSSETEAIKEALLNDPEFIQGIADHMQHG